MIIKLANCYEEISELCKVCREKGIKKSPTNQQ